MFADAGDRRRLVAATVLTVIALPLLWSSKDTSSPGTQLAVTGAAPTELNAPAASETDAPEQALLADPTAETVPADVITIDVAAEPTGNVVTTKATYRKWPDGLTAEKRPCGSPLAPFGTRIVVTNMDNGKKVACVNVTTRPLAGEDEIVIDTATFVELADLTEAPLTVELAW